MMKSAVTIIFIANHSKKYDKHFLDNLMIEKRVVETEVIEINHEKTFIGNTEIKLEVLNFEGNKNRAELINDVLRKGETDYYCIVPSGYYLQKNWLDDLIYFYEDIGKSGVVGILNDFEGLNYFPLPTNDNEHFVNVFINDYKNEQTNHDIINGVLFFDKTLVGTIGALDTTIIGSLIQYQIRAAYVGFNNYYIPTTTCIEPPNNYDKFLENSESELNISISKMIKTKSFYLPL